MRLNSIKAFLIKAVITILLFLSVTPVFASEAELKIPVLLPHQFNLLLIGIAVCVLGMIFGMYEFFHLKKLKAHNSMLEVAELIFQTAKTYLIQQGKFLVLLFLLVGTAIAVYFGVLSKDEAGHTMGFGGVLIILGWSVVGILGSYAVAWFGIRVNTLANSRMAFASLEKKPLKLLNIPLQAGMSIGVLLICVELIMMLIILLFIPREYAGACFIGFAIGESLGASALRIAGGIFTKIADIGSDLMKIVFNLKEDDPSNPGVIADCVGDNAGDSVGPTADGFETYGVTGVALITFILVAINNPVVQIQLLVWMFVMRLIMIIASSLSYWINAVYVAKRFQNAKEMNYESPLTSLVWITSLLSIALTFIFSYLLIPDMGGGQLWWKLAGIITCGTIAGAIIPEFVKIFTSTESTYVQNIFQFSKKGGASLNILAGLTAGNFSAYWMGIVILFLMGVAYLFSLQGLDQLMVDPAIFAFGLVAFGFLGMGPVTIAVDSYGPIADNAQSIYELSLIEKHHNVKDEIHKEYGFVPDFEKAKHNLESNDGAGNTFKATAKPVLIGTAVVGATTMIFSIIVILTQGLTARIDKLSLLNPPFMLGLVAGGAVIYWFTGASMHAVTAGAYQAVAFIKDNIKLHEGDKSSLEDSKKVVSICTKFVQKGMINIFMVILFSTLAFACLNPFFFVGYLISIALFGLFQANFMANAGGAWDNAKKLVEVKYSHEKGSALHAATVVGDTVGDPFKDTSSVAINPLIKFTTLFGLLAVEIAIELSRTMNLILAGTFFLISAFFILRSFSDMKIAHFD